MFAARAVLAALLSAALPYAYPQWDYYVSPTGNDSTGTGTAAAPWATITKARDYVRTGHVLDVMPQDVTIHAAAGDYSPAATITIGSADSGQSGHNVIYKCDGAPGSCRVLGGASVTGWAAYSGSVSRAAVTTGNFWTMFENEKRGRLARTPNLSVNASWPLAKSPYFRSDPAGPASSLTVLQYNTSDFNPAAWVLGDTSMYIQPGGNIAWLSDTVGVSVVDTTLHRYTTDRSLKFATIALGTGSRYIMQGDYSLLDQCGEYFYDRNDTKGAPGGGGHYLYYWPCDGAIASQTIVVPTLKQVFSFVGTSQTVRVHNVVLDGLEIEYSDFQQEFRWGCPYNGSAVVPCNGVTRTYQNYDYEASMPEARYGAVYTTNTDHITLKRLHIKNAGLNGFYAEGWNQNDVMQDSLVEHTGGGGIFIEGNYPAEGDFNKTWTITDGKVHDFSELAANLSGVTFANSGGNVLSYYEVYNGQRKAVWMYTDSPGIPQQFVYTHGNLVDHVLAHNVNQDTGDTGALGVSFLDSFTGGPYVQNTFTQIIVHDISATPDMTDVAPDCVFADNDTYGQIFTNVQAFGCAGNQFRSNSSGEHFLTNTSFKLDGTPNGSFNAALMDTANIGVTASYPY